MRHDDHERHTWEQRARQHAHQTREWTTATRKQRATWEKGVCDALERCTNDVRRRARSERATHADTRDDARETARESDGDEAREQCARHARITNVYRTHIRYVKAIV
jgi:hypothetical protein